MTVVAGSTFERLVGGRLTTYVVKAVRWAPFQYAEVEPVKGGRRQSMPLREIEERVVDFRSLEELADL
ncbi:hypothetical protein [Mycobacteroides saopaulense]|uniref:Uncharacterized protein n=1 Tax=Mycobacteroides saopaulense TaxID=1578165 RepID=A0A1S1JMT0_9MYCO|nr:hypothetical protein [Mycobacteroides saopaulense]ALR11384.1 hypothetical protein MYCSP_07825 [Mycobacteroides saopaulense]OHT86707.1 hypothetical protein BKG68_11355 [Mycobacteroides saopaulense]OHU08564.1 hypothetical protein BKG73_16045 [Mycobacteroides saopaulense]ORB59432.1 hypothetical protein BST43_07050 [Mycobacteroides saopaulense]